ncbi:unnamed protein product [Cladocopium goreaui]|uniref:Uncharacterized protein n=1 Tax=Cladocopium goreaui TaxID=2562237 RepID=A0A9P1FV81_9DINO|nr:unnamed protein product [Cladocopium goreaui]
MRQDVPFEPLAPTSLPEVPCGVARQMYCDLKTLNAAVIQLMKLRHYQQGHLASTNASAPG